MLFNSFEFIFIFLPIAFIIYFLQTANKLYTCSKIWLVIVSLFFYSWWNVAYLPLILGSLFINFFIGNLLGKENLRFNKKLLLTVGIVLNVIFLGYYKYTDFFIDTINTALSTNMALLHLALPLAISFFTFEQISYLVDSYRGETKHYTLLDYSMFVTFFPKLIAGPIVYHNEIIPQFESEETKKINWSNISAGVFIFAVGLFKKVAIADTFAVWATNGFENSSKLTLIEGWITSLSYTMQLYFDFSGYCDMAIGIALLFNINLLQNFNSPYKALDIQDFWRRWHMTLGRFLTHYIYVPLGGNRKGKRRTYINIFIIFMISGFWHGAGWTFIFWGFLHGVASMICRYWKMAGYKMNKFVAWFITFNFVNIAWVFFRAESWGQAIEVLKSMLGLNGISLPKFFESKAAILSDYNIQFNNFYLSNIEVIQVSLLIMVSLYVCTKLKNSIQMMKEFNPTPLYSLFIIVILTYGILNLSNVSEFLYFNF
ncbi:MBOAT family O-acyltransferase [Caryophanon latum]|uniref:Acetyltransferase n=1 Tax=Caryophanon latum TaxID=33977 RepID=A0A1C0YIX7_9BACL|nr:MBOAT family O-acyltransferase [Caryophanon latum]OCS87049.1 acetyltransferase [Caryophanon latum]